jgi:hypothetical protein
MEEKDYNYFISEVTYKVKHHVGIDVINKIGDYVIILIALAFSANYGAVPLEKLIDDVTTDVICVYSEVYPKTVNKFKSYDW